MRLRIKTHNPEKKIIIPANSGCDHLSSVASCQNAKNAKNFELKSLYLEPLVNNRRL